MNTFQSDAGEGPSTLQKVVPPLFICSQFISDTEGQHKNYHERLPVLYINEGKTLP